MERSFLARTCTPPEGMFCDCVSSLKVPVFVLMLPLSALASVKKMGKLHVLPGLDADKRFW
jgi:hypothetical protein